MSESFESSNVEISLGDIIQIIAPTNSSINDQIYLIEYIDETKIKLIKRLSPLLNYPTSYTISFNNPAEIENIGAAGYQKGPIFYA